jgi:hypothetical protein
MFLVACGSVNSNVDTLLARVECTLSPLMVISLGYSSTETILSINFYLT